MSPLLQLTEASVALGGRVVLAPISFAVGAGEIVALLGPNGAGKTSLLRAALGLAPLASGSVMLGNLAAAGMTARDRALRAAYLPQRVQSVWPVAVEDIVALGRYAYGAAPHRLERGDSDAVDAALAQCNLLALRKRRMDEISGGEKARTHLARALAQRAPLLMLDEPTAGLDPAQAVGVAEILRAHADAGCGALFSTHDVALAARAAHRVLLLRDGVLVADGAPEAALTPAALEAAYGRKGRLERIGDVFSAAFE